MSYRTWEDLGDDEADDTMSSPALSPIAFDDVSSLINASPRLAELSRQREFLERRMAELSGASSEVSPLRQISTDVPTMAERQADYARWEQRHETATTAMRLARREMEDVGRRWSAMRDRAIEERNAKVADTAVRLVRKKDDEPALRTLERETIVTREKQNDVHDQRRPKAPSFEFEPNSGIGAKRKIDTERPDANLNRQRKALTRDRLRLKSIELRQPEKARPAIKTAAKQERVEDRFERTREAAIAARLHQRRAARSLSDLRVLDDKLQKARETARAARQEMSLSDDMSGTRPESLYAGLDERSAPKAKQRDPKFDVDQLYERRTKKREKSIEEPTRRKKSLMEQLDDRRKAALEKRREKKKQESKRR